MADYILALFYGICKQQADFLRIFRFFINKRVFFFLRRRGSPHRGSAREGSAHI